MASPRTRKRKQQRQALKARRMCPQRPPRALTPIERIMRDMYMEVARQMYSNTMSLDGLADAVTVRGASYTYAIHTNKKPPNAGG